MTDTRTEAQVIEDMAKAITQECHFTYNMGVNAAKAALVASGRAELVKEVEEYKALIELIYEGIAFIGADWDGDKCIGHSPALLLNDTFAYASADAENVEWGKWNDILAIYKKYGRDGIITWCAHKRGYLPFKSQITSGFKKAYKALSPTGGE